MGRRWAVALFLVVLLMAPSATAAWDQYQGNQERNALLDPLPPLMDVLEIGTLRDEPMDLGSVEYAPVILRTDAGWLWSERRYADPEDDLPLICAIVQRRDLSDEVNETAVISNACDTGLLQGFDPVTGHTLLCSYAREGDILIRAVQPDGRAAWSWTPDALGWTATKTDEEPNSADIWWNCQGTALHVDERIAYVAFFVSSTSALVSGMHGLAAFDLDDGRPLWRTEIQDRHGHDGIAQPNLAGTSPPNQGNQMYVGGMTVVDDALVVAFGKTCPTCWDGDAAGIQGLGPYVDADVKQAAFAWFDRDTGAQIGLVDRDPAQPLGSAEATVTVSGSRFAAARDGLAVFYHWDRAVFVDPNLDEPVLEIPIKGSGFGDAVATAAPVWWNQYAIVPTEQWLTAIHADRREVAWQWAGGPNWNIEHVAVSSDGDLLVLIVDWSANEEAKVVRLSAASGTVRQEIPVLLDVTRDSGFFFPGNRWRVDMVQDASGGVAIVDSRGSYARVGAAPADSGATLALSDVYPSRGDSVEIRLSTASDKTASQQQVQVLWGDDTRRTYAPGDEMVHRFPDNGEHEIVATALYTDNTTRSATATVYVGGTPPQELTRLQQVFAPENADVTWGVAGILIAVFGGLMAFARARLRKNRLEYKLAELERLKARAIHDVPGAIRDVDAYRADLRADLRRGKLDDIQYAVLEGEIQRSLRLWYHRLLAPYEARMSDRFRRHLTGSLEDGTLHPPEAHRLVDELSRENRLKADEKAHLRAFFEEWSHTDTA